jgi:hypothetical protein
MFLVLLSLVHATDLIDQEIQETFNLITLFQEKIKGINDFRVKLQDQGIEIPENDDWKTLPGLIPQPDHDSLPQRLKSLGAIPVSSKSLDFIALKGKEGSLKIGLVICQGSLISVYSSSAELLGTYALNNILFCAASSTPDDPLIGVVAGSSPFELAVLSFDGSVLQLLSSRRLLNDTALPTAFINYSRLGKKYWIAGDDRGRITFFAGNGEVIGQGNTSTTSVTLLDKFGSQVVFAGDNKVGVYNLGTLEVFQMCEPALYDVVDVAQDFSATVIYVLVRNGDILVYDTKHSSSTSAPMCKSVARFDNHFYKPSKLVALRGSLLAISNNVVISYNFSSLETDIFYPPTFYKVRSKDGQTGFKSLRMPNAGNYLVIFNSAEINLYEVTNVFFTPGNAPFDYTGPLITIFMFIGGIVLWKLLQGQKKQKQQSNQSQNYSRSRTSEKNVRFNENPQVFRYKDE